jgi:anti-sigma regulatory factor (Ser/Thr protein kinase)
MKKLTYQFPSQLEELRKIREFIRQFFLYRVDEINLDRIILAIDEGISNVILHGYKLRRDKEIELELGYDENEVYAIISDRAPLFNDKDRVFNLRDFVKNPKSGLGLYLMHRIMEVEYTPREGGGNHLILRKKLPYQKE